MDRIGACERAFVLTLLQEVEQLREQIKELKKCPLDFRWIFQVRHGEFDHLDDSLILYAGNTVIYDTQWNHHNTYLEVGNMNSGFSRSKHFMNFLKDLELNDDTNHIVFFDHTVFMRHTDDIFIISGANGVPSPGDMIISEKIGFDIIRKYREHYGVIDITEIDV